jgi:predicted membrane protein
MEFSKQFKDSFRQGLIAGYFFTATFLIVFYLSYCLPTQIKMRKNKNLRLKKSGEVSKLPNQDLKQQKIKEVLHLLISKLVFQIYKCII